MVRCTLCSIEHLKSAQVSNYVTICYSLQMRAYYRIVGNIVEGLNLANWRFSGNLPNLNLPIFDSIYYVKLINGTIIGLLKYLRKGRTMHVCSALWKKETEQGNECVRQVLMTARRNSVLLEVPTLIIPPEYT